MIDVLEPTTPPPAPRRHRRAVLALAAGTALALVAGLAVNASGGGDPEPLALVAGGEGDARAEGAAMSASDLPAADPAGAQSSFAYPTWGGMEYEVEGDLPDLGSKGRAWRVLTPDLDRDTVATWAAALNLSGRPEQRDGAWVAESDGASLSVYPGDGWSVGFQRTRAEWTGGRDGPSAAEAEAEARSLLERLGVIDGEWRVQTNVAEIGVAYACAEEIKLRELEITRLAPDAPVASDAPATSVAPAPPSIPDCPPPAPPVPGQNVSFFPVLDGMRTEWSGWNVTVGPQGVESLYGTWARFEPADEYKLRSVDAALDELRDGGRVVTLPMPLPADDVMNAPAADSGPAMSGPAPAPAGTTEPAIAPCPPEADCVAPEPQRVTITGVEMTLLPNPVYSGRRTPAEMYLVPAYRFTGTMGGGEPWETSVIALHPDAIAPPPPVDDTGAVKGIEVDSPPAAADGTGGGASGFPGREPLVVTSPPAPAPTPGR